MPKTKRQEIGGVGTGAVVIQIQGDNNIGVLVDGRPSLRLLTPEGRRKGFAESSELHLLRPDMGITRLLGRDEQLKDFLGWAKSKKLFSIRSVIGPAGAGKTRFALELLKALKANRSRKGKSLIAGGWCGGFLDFDEVEAFDTKQSLSQCVWPNPVLIVVDYAATAGSILGTWLNFTARYLSEKSRPVRVLLLERRADTQAGWLSSLLSYDSDTSPGLRGWFDPAEPISLEPLTGAEVRRELLQNMLGVLAKRTKASVPPLPKPGEKAFFDKRLNADQWANPLYLMMAAAVAVGRGEEKPLVDVLALSRTDLAQGLARREISRIKRGTEDEAKQLLRIYLAVCATLARGLDAAGAMSMAKSIEKQTNLKCQGGSRLIVGDLMRLLAGDDGGVGGIGPDIVGEAFVYLGLTGGEPPLGDAERDSILLSLLTVDGKHPLELLMLLIQDFGVERPEVLEWLDHLIKHGREKDFDLLLSVADELPDNTLILRERAANLQATIVHRLRSVAKPPDPVKHKGQTAMALNNLGNRLSDLGRREQALEATKEAVDIYRNLAKQRPDAFLPDLATALGALHVVYKGMGRAEEAQGTIAEALEILTPLFEAVPQAHARLMAQVLKNYLEMSLLHNDSRAQPLDSIAT